jgi:uncharacterized membrane protein
MMVIIKHMLFHTYAFDLGIFVQALYTTWADRRILFETPDSIISESYLGIHFSPILFLFVPLVGFFPPAETLLLLQTAILALPTYFLYRDVYIKTGSKRLANLISVWYLLNPALHSTNLYDFHTQSLMILSSYFLIGELKKHNITKSVIFLLLLFTMSEQALFIGLGCILYLLIELRHRKRIWVKGFIAIAFTTALMTAIAFATISTFGKSPIHPKNPTKFFPQLGSTWAEVLSNMLSWKIINAITHDIFLKISYWLVLLFPLYFYNRRIVVREAIPVLFPWMIFTFISGYTPFYTLGWQFNGLVLGIIAATASEVIGEFKETKLSLRKYVIAVSTLAILLSPVSIVPYYFSDFFHVAKGGAYDFNPLSANILDELEIASTIKTALSLVPKNASILCTSNIFPHVATRPNAYVGNIQNVEYILLDYRYVNLGQFDQRLLQLVSKLNESYKYGVVVNANGILLLKKNYISQPLLFKQYEVTIDPSKLSWQEIIPDFDSKGHAVLKFSTEEEKMVWYGPYITVPPGLYEIKINVSLNFKGKLMIEVTNFADNGKRLTMSDSDTFQVYIPIDNIIEIKGFIKGVGELTLYNIHMKLIKI